MFEHGLIQMIQQMTSPVMDKLFIAITFLGEEDFYLILLPIIFWAIDRTLGSWLIVLFLSSMFVNQMAKDFFAMPRPDPARVRVIHAHSGTGYGLPSGHSQGPFTLWGYMAVKRPHRALVAAALILVPAIALSRLYLGLHFPGDVLAGWGLAFVIILLGLGAEQLPVDWSRVRPVMALLPLAALALYRGGDAYKLVGYAVGFIAGIGTGVAEKGKPRSGGILKVALKVVIGLAGLQLLRMATGPITPEGPLQLVRYALLGLWGGDLAPRIFQALGLETRSHRTPRRPAG